MADSGILLYNVNNEKLNKIDKLCHQLNIKVKLIKPREFNLPIESIAKFDMTDIKIFNSTLNNEVANSTSAKEYNKNSQEVNFSEEMLIMVNFSEELLDKFLREYKVKHIDPVYLKAILTPHNKSWSSTALKEELKRERLEMSRLSKKK